MANTKAFQVKNGLNIESFTKQIGDTAKHVFVYDTSTDSDGGAWRHRCQGTSWYNETLNTATRGSRKEFPAVAIIVTEIGEVTIYDGDEPDCPMWMVFTNGSFTTYAMGGGPSGAECTVAKNGLLANANLVYGYNTVNLISENCTFQEDGYARNRWGGVVARNGGMVLSDDYGSNYDILDDDVYHVDLIVRPDASIDPATNLPIPLAALATKGGLCLVWDNNPAPFGTVSNVYYSDTYNDVTRVSWNDRGEIGFAAQQSGSTTNVYNYNIIKPPVRTISSSNYRSLVNDLGGRNYESRVVTTYYNDVNLTPYSYTNGASNLQDVAMTNDGFVAGFPYQLSRVLETDFTSAGDNRNAIAYIGKDYNSGFMNGSIRLASLASTDEYDITGSELVTNGDFASDVSGWSVSGTGATLTWNAGGYAELNRNGSSATMSQTITTVAGRYYTVQYDLVSSSGSAAVQATFGDGTYPASQSSTLQRYTFTGYASGTSTNIQISVFNTTTGTCGIDNVSIREGLPDRSVRNCGFQVFGTVSADPVATGSELLYYGPLTSTNYLYQPYRSELDFTSSMTVMFWVKDWANGMDLAHRGPATTRNSKTSWGLYCDSGYDYRLFLSPNGTTEYNAEIPNASNLGDWQFVCFSFDRPSVQGWLNDRLLYSEDSFDFDIFSQATDENGLYLGVGPVSGSTSTAKVALFRVSQTPVTDEQVKAIYAHEAPMFKQNSMVTLYGTSEDVEAVAFDPVTKEVHAGTSDGRSVFQGLVRVDNTTESITESISAVNGFVAED